ncbi:MAG: protease complex subunit PrcB family protein, partial [Lachnospiraceae bacterium]
MKKAGFFILLIAVLASGCTIRKEDTEKLRDIDFTVVESEDVPEELRDIIQEKQENETKLFYADEGYLYVVRGYGKQDTSGYSVEVRDCYETENTI